MLDVYENIYELLKNKESFCLATILSKTGSAPREEGSQMIIKKDSSIIGTIGGGLSEALTIKLGKSIFENKSSIIKYFNLSNKGASSLGLACGGEVKVLVEYIGAEDPKIVDTYTKGYEMKQKCDDFVLISKIEDDAEYYDHNKWVCSEKNIYGEENSDIQEVFNKIQENFKKLKISIVSSGEHKYLVEPVRNIESAFIFGAGHVSQKLAEVTKMVDFRTVVLDDRSEFANRERFKNADDVIVMKDFNNICDYVNINNQSYIIIVTRGHACDKEVLAQALKTKAKYIGMIGSKSKTKFVYDKLLEEGYTQKDLDRVYAPIGLDIYAETPEEIAISITAEIIKIRREPKNGK